MGVRRNFSKGGRRHFTYLFQVTDDAMQMDVQNTLYPFNTAKNTPMKARTLAFF